MTAYTTSDAILSACGFYRYELRRVWDANKPALVWVMLNPSKADGTKDDPTIRVCVGRAKLLGYGGVLIVNLYAWRSTDPRGLLTAADPVGPLNDSYITRATSDQTVVCAWGTHGGGRADVVKNNMRVLGAQLHYIDLTKDGHPCHPLRKSYGLPLLPWLT